MNSCSNHWSCSFLCSSQPCLLSEPFVALLYLGGCYTPWASKHGFSPWSPDSAAAKSLLTPLSALQLQNSRAPKSVLSLLQLFSCFLANVPPWSHMLAISYVLDQQSVNKKPLCSLSPSCSPTQFLRNVLGTFFASLRIAEIPALCGMDRTWFNTWSFRIFPTCWHHLFLSLSLKKIIIINSNAWEFSLSLLKFLIIKAFAPSLLIYCYFAF